MNDAQAAELAKYPVAYERPGYAMSRERAASIEQTLAEISPRRSYLDVGCGRGEMLAYARRLGFGPVFGTETVEALLGPSVRWALAWALPFADASFDVVSMLDVIEHLLPGDDELACRELARVASGTIIITANNLSSAPNGVELHCNRRPYPEWDALFRTWFPGEVTWLRKRRAKRSELWRVDLR